MISFKLKRAFILVFAGTVWLMSCKKAAVKPDTVEPKPVDPQPEKFTYTANVYACGSVMDTIEHKMQAVYWKNGVATLLSRDNQFTSADAIAVKDNNVYVAGSVKNNAVYWKNGVMTKLENGTKSSLAVDILISGNDVYLAGYVDNEAVYWKNGLRTTLSRSPKYNEAVAFGIGVSGSDIYVTGYQYNSETLAVATVWKNGTPTILAGSNTVARNVTTHNNDTYIAVSYGLLSADNTLTNYWKNGIPVALPKTVPINTFKIVVEDDNVYVAGGTEKGPAYYKNDKLTIIDEKTSSIRSIIALNNDVYVAGYSIYQKNQTATFWKNGQRVRLFSTVGNVSSVSDIAVTQLQ